MHDGGGGGEEGTLKFFIHTYAWGYFLGFKILNFNIFWGFQKKKKHFFRYEDFVDIFWGSPQNWPLFRGHFYALCGLFLKPTYKMGDKFLGCKNFKYVLG